MPRSEPTPPAPSVLVVETSPLLTDRLARLAGLDGRLAVAVVESAVAAISRLGASRFEVVVVDVDGLRWPELPELGELRAAWPDALLMALTTDYEPETIRACRARGADLVLDLSGDLHELTARLRARTGAPAAARAK